MIDGKYDVGSMDPTVIAVLSVIAGLCAIISLACLVFGAYSRLRKDRFALVISSYGFALVTFGIFLAGSIIADTKYHMNTSGVVAGGVWWTVIYGVILGISSAQILHDSPSR